MVRHVPATAGYDVRGLDDFTVGYLNAAAWVSEYDDSHGIDRVAPEAVERAAQECSRFQQEQAADLAEFYRLAATGADAGAPESLGGYCFWMSRVGAGVGFWDRGVGQVGDRLHEATDSFGHVDLYEGYDGQLYFF